jgi:phosphatidylglycerol:prolipoprotein diacylglycerol transferase
MYDVTIFGIDITLNPVAFTLPIGDGWKVYWYGILIALGFLGALIYAYTNYKRFNLDMDRAIDVVLATLPVAIVCARAYYVIFDGEKLTSFKDFFGLGDGQGFAGLGIYGGVIGAFVTGFLMCKLRKVNFADMFDIAAIGFLIGQGIGRWGNFVNREVFGEYTDNVLAMRLPIEAVRSRDISENIRAHIVEGTNYIQVHPTFLYESGLNLMLLLGMWFYRKHKRLDGEMVLWYLGGYGIIRFFVEGMRTDQLQIGNTGIEVSQMLGGVLFVGSVITAVVIHTKLGKNTKETVKVEKSATEEKKTEKN